MPKQLTNLTVTEVSILTGELQPANGEGVIIKSDRRGAPGGSPDNQTKPARVEIVAKADKCIDGLIYCTVMKANTPDSDGEQADPATIRKAAHEFLKSYRKIDENHNHVGLNGVYVAESYICKQTGDWKAVFDVSNNAAIMEKAKKGEITGVSIYGTAERVGANGGSPAIPTKNSSKLRQAWEILSSFFKSEEEQPDAELQIQKNQPVGANGGSPELGTDPHRRGAPAGSPGNQSKQEKSMTKDELKTLLAEIDAEKQSNGLSEEVETLKAKNAELTAKIEKQDLVLEVLKASRETGGGLAPDPLAEIMKCTDPAKQAQLLECYKQNYKS